MRDNTSQGIYSDLITIKDVFHNHLKIIKNLQYILCRNREKIRATASKGKMCRNRKCAADIFFYLEDCMTASRNISMFFKERAAASEKILRKNDCF